MGINGGSAALTRACANSKIFIFRFGGEGEHTNQLQNICVGVNILQSICVFTLSANAEYVYFAICGCFRVLGHDVHTGNRIKIYK